MASTLTALASPAFAAERSAPYREFEHVCLSIFARRASPEDAENATGNRICKCTSEESKHQGVSVAELKKETTRIRANPKYQIKNPKLLAAFHWCVILAMDQKSHEEDSHSPNAK